MRHLLVTALASSLLATAAFAQAPADPAAAPAPKKAKKPAATSIGSAKEDDEPAPRPKARAEPPAEVASSGDDAALARALVWAFEPAPQEIRVLAVEDLALLGDARALNPLAQLIFDANPQIQSAAIRAIGRFHTPRAEEILANVIRHPVINEKLKLQAIDLMVYQRSATSRELLARVSSTSSFPFNLQSAAKRALADWGPVPTR